MLRGPKENRVEDCRVSGQEGIANAGGIESDGYTDEFEASGGAVRLIDNKEKMVDILFTLM